MLFVRCFDSLSQGVDEEQRAEGQSIKDDQKMQQNDGESKLKIASAEELRQHLKEIQSGVWRNLTFGNEMWEWTEVASLLADCAHVATINCGYKFQTQCTTYDKCVCG